MRFIVHEQLKTWTSYRRPTSAAGLERSFLQRKVQLDAKSEAMNVDRKHKTPCAVRILHLACQPHQRRDGSGRVCDLV